MVDLFIIIPIWILSLVSTVLLIIIFIMWSSQKNNSLLHLSETIVLLEVFNRLGLETHQEARKTIYESYLEYQKNKDISIFLDPTLRKQAEIVKADFDVIGLLYEYGYLNKNTFFDLYSDSTRRCWIALEDQIKNERKVRSSNKNDMEKTSDHFMDFFERLAKHAKKYRDQKNLDEPSFTDFRSTN